MARKLAIVCFLFLSSTCLLAHAVGVGSIELRSALNAPLEARIPLTGVSPGDLESVSVRLASAGDFAKAGLERQDHLRALRFTVVSAANGKPYIRVSSRRPIREPVLNFLVEVSWHGGRVLKEYALLIDLPPRGAANPPPDVATAGNASAAKSTTAFALSAAEIAGAPSPGRYGPTRRNDTLHSIALQLRPDASVTPAQVMLAILAKNPNAFVDGNVNRLKTGQLLLAPTLDEIQRLDLDQAARELARQTEVWRAGTAPPTSAVRPPRPTTAEGGLAPGAGARNPPLEAKVAQANEMAESLGKENATLRGRLADLEATISGLQEKVSERDAQISSLHEQPQPGIAKPAATDAEPEAPIQTPGAGGKASEPAQTVASETGAAPAPAEVAPGSAAPTEPPAEAATPAARGETPPLEAAAPALVEVTPAEVGLGSTEAAESGTEPAASEARELTAAEEAPISEASDASESPPATEEPNLVITMPAEPTPTAGTGTRAQTAAPALPAEAPSEQPAAAAPPAPAKLAHETAPPPEPSGDMLGSPWMLGGMAVVVAGVVGAVVFFRRRPGAAPGPSEEDFRAAVHSAAARPARGSAASGPEVEPDGQEPRLEPHTTAVSTYEDLSGELPVETEEPTQLDFGIAETGGASAAAWGRQPVREPSEHKPATDTDESWRPEDSFETVALDHSPLDTGAGRAAEETLFADGMDLELDIGAERSDPLDSDGELMFEVNEGPKEPASSEPVAPAPAAVEADQAAAVDLSTPLDFDIGEPAGEEPPVQPAAAAEPGELQDNVADWSIDGQGNDEQRPADTVVLEGWAPSDAGETMLDFPSEPQTGAERGPETARWTEESPRLDAEESWLDVEDEVATKLELARAYIDMESTDSALSVLQEVVEEGSDAQRRDAQELIRGLQASV